MNLARPEFLQMAALVVLLILISGIRQVRRRRKLAAFLGGHRGAGRVARHDLYSARVMRALLLSISAIALGVAAAEPRADAPPPPPPPAAPRSVLIAIDVSASMQASDASPNRLGQGVAAARQLVDAAGADRIGLLLFAGESYLLSPPTHDHRVIRFLLDGVTPGIASAHDPGSRLSVPLEDARALLGSTVAMDGERHLVLITDGEAGESERIWRSAVEDASRDGIRVHAIAVGTESGRGMSLPRGQYQLGGPVVRADGSTAVSRAAPAVLRRIADASGGSFALAADPAQVAEFLQAFRPAAPGATSMVDPRALPRMDLVTLLLLWALALIVLESLLDARLPRLAPLPRRREA